MNIKIISAFFPLCMLVLLWSCGKDNYDAPESTLTGRIVYQGQALNVRGTDERVRLQLYQDGYAKRDPIEVFVGQEGTFSAKLFDGEYKLVTRNGNGPWVNSRDTTVVVVKGSADIELEVMPFFTISDSQISIANNVLNCSFTVNRIVENAEIERIILLLNTTSFVDDGFNVMRKDFTEDLTTGPVTLSADLNGNSAVSNAQTLFGRICVWTSGADQGLYSPVVRLR